MSPALAFAVIAALLATAALLAGVLRRRDGRRRDVTGARFDPAHADGVALASTATLVQFSTELCARCPAARRVLRGYAAGADGVRHVEVDLTHRPELAARYRVFHTPTTFVVDPTGAVRSRFHGVPTAQGLADALSAI